MAKKKPCEYCETETYLNRDGQNGHELAVEIYPFNNMLSIISFARDEDGETIQEEITLDYEYCMFCGRKLI